MPGYDSGSRNGRLLIIEVVSGPASGEAFPLPPGQYLVGRDLSCDVRVDEADVACSRYQAMMIVAEDEVRIIDRESTNGTFVNESRVRQASLNDGDVIRVGKTNLSVRFVERAGTKPKIALYDEEEGRIDTVRLSERRSSESRAYGEEAANDDEDTAEREPPEPKYFTNRIAVAPVSNPFVIRTTSTDPFTGEAVVVKQLRPEIATDAASVQAFRRTSNVLINLNHPGVEQIRSVNVEGGRIEIITTPPNGPELATRVERSGGRLPLDQVFVIARGILDALRATHDCSVVHQGLNPGCIFLDGDAGFPNVTVGDFGLARHFWTIDEHARLGDELRSPLPYAPKQLLLGSRIADRRVDLFAVGAMMFRMTFGESMYAFDRRLTPPYDTIVEDLRIDPRSLGVSVPEGLYYFFGRATSSTPGDRFQNAEEMAEALEDLASAR